MSTLTHLFPGLNIYTDNTDPCVWIRTNAETVSITFDSPDQIAAMRAALDGAEANLRGQAEAA